MRRIVLFTAATLDLYIAGKKDQLDWLFSDGDYGYTPFLASVDTVVMGRKTFDIIRSFGDYPYKDKTSYIFSRTAGEAPEVGAPFINEPIGPFMEKVKAAPGEDIWLVGGGELVQAFLDHDLVDRMILSIHPILLGEGKPLFPAPTRGSLWRLEKCEPFENGLVQVTYDRAREIASP